MSLKTLEDVTGQEILGLAYPWGRYNKVVKEVVGKYYLYARSTEIVGSGSELYNAPPRSIYELGAIPIFALKRFSLPKFIWDSHKFRNAKPIAYTHKPGTLKLKTAITILKTFGFEFVTVDELFENSTQ